MGGRFKQALNPAAVDFSYSLSFDQVLLPYVSLNKAHSSALVKRVFLPKECQKLHKALDEVLKDAPKA